MVIQYFGFLKHPVDVFKILGLYNKGREWDKPKQQYRAQEFFHWFKHTKKSNNSFSPIAKIQIQII